MNLTYLINRFVMNKYLKLLILILIIGHNLEIMAQEEKPKVALVLSGGGAKGIAHIPLLQTLDSLGIVPDFIIGTSMGSVVGGLYAAGYSGDSIAVLTHNANWAELLGGDISLQDVTIEEKSEFKTYLADFDLIEGKPKVSSGLIKDQKLREYLSKLTYPVFNVTDFDDLPTPYRAMTTDIVNGKEVLLERGSLGFAMRASMSIPGVFEPVPYDDTLLVDGGVLNNFPVDIAKEMGYDIIIGSDVGGGMQTKDKLNSIPALLFQAGMLTSNLKNPENRALCDILVDHMPYLTYSTGDFEKGDEIYEEGRLAIVNKMDELVALANQLKGYEQRSHEIPDVKDEFLLDSIVYEGISDANLDIVKARSGIHAGQKYTTQELIDGVDRAMGTNLFSQITYSGSIEDNRIILTLKGYEHSRHQIKASLHYDSFRNVGIILNYTGRNVLGKSSRFLVTLDVAVQPRFRVQYQKQFGVNKDWWWRSDVLGEFLVQSFFLSGEQAEDMFSRYGQFESQLNKNLKSRHSYAGLDLSYEYTTLVPKVDSDINNNIFYLDRYNFQNIEIGIHYMYSKMDKVYYPSKGTYFRAGIYRSVLHDLDVKFSTDEFTDVKGSTNGFTKLVLDFERRFKFSKTFTGIVGGNLGFSFEDDLKTDEYSFLEYGYAAKYSLGGILRAPRRGNFVFAGLNEDELAVAQFMRINLAAQFNPMKKVFITPHFDLATVGDIGFNDYIENAFSPVGSWEEGFEASTLMSAGATFAYHSILGPVNFDVSWVNDINKVRVFFSVGLILNRSN
jgi:NTE family protein